VAFSLFQDVQHPGASDSILTLDVRRIDGAITISVVSDCYAIKTTGAQHIYPSRR